MTGAPPDPKEERCKRAYDHLQLMLLAKGNGALNKWVAISLADGSCDQHPYESKAEAIRFQLHETQCAYLFFNGMPRPGELRFFLDLNEDLYDNGLSLSDPDTYVNPEFFL